MKDGFLSLFLGWLYVSGVSLFGIMVRIGMAAGAQGDLQWRQVWIAGLTAPGLGIIANGLALWMYPELPPQVLAGVIALVGFLGPAFVLSLSDKIRETWVGKAGAK